MTFKKNYHTSLAESNKIARKIQQETALTAKKKELDTLWETIIKEVNRYQGMLMFPTKNRDQQLTKLSKRIDSLGKEYSIACIV